MLASILFSVAAACTVHGSEERVRELIAQLSHDEFDVREEATRTLIKAGEPAWPQLREALSRAAEDEVKARLQRIALEVATPSEDEQCRAAFHFEKLFDALNENRTEGFQKLQDMGPVGVRLLRRHLSAAGAKFSLTASADATVITEGQPVVVTTVLRNDGVDALWFPESTSLRSRGSSYGKFSGRRRIMMTSGRGCGFLIEKGPLVYIWALAPGAEVRSTQRYYPSRPGFHSWRVYAYPEQGREVELNGLRVRVNEAAPKLDAAETSKSASVIVLPDLNRCGPEDNALQLSCLPLPGEDASLAKFQIVLRSLSPEPLVLSNLRNCGWYMWLREDGHPAGHGGWKFEHPADEKVLATVVRPGGALYVPLDISRPPKPGRYALLLGFQADGDRGGSESQVYSGNLYLKLDNAAVVGE